MPPWNSARLLAAAGAHTTSLQPETVRPVPSSLAGVFGGTLFQHLRSDKESYTSKAMAEVFA